MRIEFELDEPAVRRLLQSPDGDVARAVRQLADRTANLARGMAPVDSGALRASIRVEVRYSSAEVKAWVYTPLEYGLYVHEGTGIYGPLGRPIRPKRGQFLVFEARNARTTAPGRGRLVFAREVRGQRPQRYLLEALRTAAGGLGWPVDDSVIYT